MTEQGSRRQKWVVCALLGAAVLATFWPAVHCGFIDYDDNTYVRLNPEVQHGLNWQSIRWAFTTGYGSNWHPVTWLSHMIDYQLYGLEPAGHHLTSLLLHLTNSLLLLLLLNRLTDALWPSAFVAAMFALHPLRVEAVVWIAERKDLLCSLFWILAVGAYVRFVEGSKVQGSKFKVFYALALVFFALALMSKPMVVTLPFVLLLLDYWPLARFEFRPKFSWRLVLEKIPFVLLAAGDTVVTYLAQHSGGAVPPLSRFPLSMRLSNIPVAYMSYLAKSFWPINLSLFYPHRHIGPLELGCAVGLLGAVSVLVLLCWRARPYLAVGWLWFLGMLVPTIGLVQTGGQAMADRYTYLPCVGLWIMVAWGVRDWIGVRLYRRIPAAVLGVMVVIACLALTPWQIHFWRNTRELYNRGTAVIDHHYLINYNLGRDAMLHGQYPQAIHYLQEAVRDGVETAPWIDHSFAFNDLGYACLHEGEITNALTNLELALLCRKANFPEAYYNFGCALLINNQPDLAVNAFRHALAMDSSVPEIHYKLANALTQIGQPAEAIAQFSLALQLRPGMDEAADSLAWLLATCSDRSLRNGAKAVALARQASEHSHDQNPLILGTLAAAYAEAGQLPDAAATAERARQLALAQNNRALAGVLESQCQRYRGNGGGSHP
jgi:tetratricopeptide (TPR) repeat protein